MENDNEKVTLTGNGDSRDETEFLFGMGKGYVLLLIVMMVPSAAIGYVLGEFVNSLTGLLVFAALLFKDWLMLLVLQGMSKDKKEKTL